MAENEKNQSDRADGQEATPPSNAEKNSEGAEPSSQSADPTEGFGTHRRISKKREQDGE
jgi:hypothetical protein